jgi:hypothetical protein
LVGLVLFGIAIFRSGFSQRWSGIALAISPLLIYGGLALAHSPLHLDRAVGIGHAFNSLVFAWIAFGLLQQTRRGTQPATMAPGLTPVVAPSVS